MKGARFIKYGLQLGEFAVRVRSPEFAINNQLPLGDAPKLNAQIDSNKPRVAVAFKVGPYTDILNVDHEEMFKTTLCRGGEKLLLAIRTVGTVGGSHFHDGRPSALAEHGHKLTLQVG